MPITKKELASLIRKISVKTRKGPKYCCGLFSKNIPPYKIKKHWENFSRNQQLPQTMVIDLENIETLQLLMKEIHVLNSSKDFKQRITVRAAAGGKKNILGKEREYSESFSFTSCVEADLIVRLVGPDFQEIRLIDADKKIVSVGAGVQIGTLDQTLYEGLPLDKTQNKLRLSLPTSSLIPHVTFIGLANNAGHGTGYNQPSVSGLIRALILCRPDGELARIDENHPDFETIRACFFSLFGIVIAVEIECMDAVKLECVSEARTIPDFLHELEMGLIQDSSYFSAIYIPTYDETSRNPSKNVLALKWQPVALDVPDQNDLPVLSHLGQALSIELNAIFHLGAYLSKHPKLIPTYMRDLVSKIEVGSKDGISIGPLPDIAHYQTAFPRNIDDADYLFPFKPDGSDGRPVTRALEKVVSLLNHYAEKGLYPVIDAIYLRFFKGTNGGLSTSFHKEDEYICAFDIVSDPSIPGYFDFKKEVQEFFIKELRARPHWGKTAPLDLDYAALYGKGYEDFKQALNRWHQACGLPLEKNPFLNRFFCTILQLPYAPEATLQEQAEEKKEMPMPSSLRGSGRQGPELRLLRQASGPSLKAAPQPSKVEEEKQERIKPQFT